MPRHHHPSRTSGFMSRAQVADEFGFSVSFLNHLPTSELPYFKRGSKVFYEREAVIRYIKGEVSPPSEPSATSGSRGRPRKPALETAAASVR